MRSVYIDYVSTSTCASLNLFFGGRTKYSAGGGNQIERHGLGIKGQRWVRVSKNAFVSTHGLSLDYDRLQESQL